MKSLRKIASLVVAAALVAMMLFAFAGCGGSDEAEEPAAADAGETQTLSIAYQYGLAYAPAVIAKDQGLIEKHYKELTGNDIVIEWNQMSSGPDINTGIASGTIDVGFMGIAPAITGVMSGLDYRIFANISGQRHGMMTNDPSINSLADLVGSDKQVALVNTGSIQHLILAKALAENGYDAHALDSNIVAMKHPDGMQALQSGSLACHLTSSPYIFVELDDPTLHEIPEVSAAWTADDSFIVGVASTALHDDAEAYEALCAALAEAKQFIADNPEEAAQILCAYDDNTVEVELEYLTQGSYADETRNLFAMATFMAENGFLDTAPASYSDLVYDNVQGD